MFSMSGASHGQGLQEQEVTQRVVRFPSTQPGSGKEGAKAESEKRGNQSRDAPKSGEPADKQHGKERGDRTRDTPKEKKTEKSRKRERSKGPFATSAKRKAEPPSEPSRPSSDRRRSRKKKALYGVWTHEPDEKDPRPGCLHLFAGPEREGDLAQQLVGKGWVVCSVDILQPTPTNLLDQGVRQQIIADVDDGFFDHIHLGTPCDTYSQLRENQPYRPLRSPTELEGIKDGLTPQEKKKLQEGNEHTSFSADVMVTAIGSGTSFALENPEPLNEVSIFNMPKMQSILRQHEVKCVDFDQCRYGAETKKPTRLAFYRVDHKSFNGSRCNHVKKEWKDKDGKTYMAPHERLAGRKRKSADGREEFASKALGNYPAKFCKALAENIARVETERAREARGPPEVRA